MASASRQRFPRLLRAVVDALALAAVLGGSAQANPPTTKPTASPTTTLPGSSAPAASAPAGTKEANRPKPLSESLGLPAGVVIFLGGIWFLFTRGKPIQENKKAWQEMILPKTDPADLPEPQVLPPPTSLCEQVSITYRDPTKVVIRGNRNTTITDTRIGGDLIVCPETTPGHEPLRITRADREPEVITRGDLLVGQAPRLCHLSQGFFASRNWHLNALLSHFSNWVEGSSYLNDVSRRIPIFWIGGRSGSGKSILLLQFISNLYQSDFGEIFWLSHYTEQLPQYLEYSQSNVQEGRKVAIAMDDPYTPDKQADAVEYWNEAIYSIEKVRDSTGDLPILIACGPTEQANSLKRDLSDDVNVEIWILDDSKDRHYVHVLEQWFKDRTGEPAPTVGNGDVLTIQRFFEWRTGESLQSFARRFRDRVSALDKSDELSKFVCSLLAVNRLYSGLPEKTLDILSFQTRDGLEKLKSDHHIGIDIDGGRTGIWLAHPHLSDALFRGWYGEGHPYQMSEALADGIKRSFIEKENHSHRMAPLWSIYKAWCSDPSDPLYSRLDRTCIRDVLVKVYGHELTLPDLPVWMRLSLAIKNMNLEPDPILKVISILNDLDSPVTGLRLSCHVLLDSLSALSDDLRSQCLTTIRSIIDRFPDWHEWPHIATSLAYQSNAYEDSKRLLSWLSNQNNYTSLKAAGPLLIILKNLECKRQHTRELLEFTLPWLHHHQDSGYFPVIFQELNKYPLSIKNREELYYLSMEWLSLHKLNPKWNIVLSLMLETYRNSIRSDDFIQIAVEWLVKHQDQDQCNYVLQALCESRLDSANQLALIEIGLSWLKSHSHEVRWSYVFSNLLDFSQKHSIDTKSLVSIALDWLQHQEHHAGWPFVMMRAIEINSGMVSLGDLIQKSLYWLRNYPEDPYWSNLLERIIVMTSTNTSFNAGYRSALRTLLMENQGTSRWAFILETLLQHTHSLSDKDDLIDLGISWLRGRESHKEAGKFLQCLLQSSSHVPIGNNLCDVCLNWLALQDTHLHWNYVLRQLIEVSPRESHQNLYEIGMEWLSSHYKERQWFFVLKILLELLPSQVNTKDLIVKITQWYQFPYNRKFIPGVIKLVMASNQDQGLHQYIYQISTHWLSRNEDKREWLYVLRSLLDTQTSFTKRSELFQIWLHWLELHVMSPNWSFTLENLLDYAEDTDTKAWLEGIAIQWLDVHLSDDAWPHLMKKLLRVSTNRLAVEKLIAKAESWIQANPDNPQTPKLKKAILHSTNYLFRC